MYPTHSLIAIQHRVEILYGDKIVLVVGAGTISQPIVTAILKEGRYRVRMLLRAEKQVAWLPSEVEIVRGDLSDKESLAAACKDVFAVLSLVSDLSSPNTLVDGQKNLADAAEAAGVRQFYPSEFGFAYTKVKRPGPVHEWKHELLLDLQERSAKNPSFAWTAMANGPFLEFWCGPKLSVNFEAGTSEFYGTGEEVVSFVTLADLGSFVAASIGREEFYNQVVEVTSFNTTWNKVLEELNSHLAKPLTVTYIPVSELEETYKQADNATLQSYISIKINVGKGCTIDDDAVRKAFPTVAPQELKDAVKAIADANKM